MPPGRRRSVGALVLLAAALLLAVGVVTALRGSADPAEAAAPPGLQGGPQGRVPQFVVLCAYSHSGTDDPIVHPGHPGASHLHDFFGNRTTDASSTLDSLLGQASSCERPRDTAAYWAPALYDGGVPVRPQGADVYYRPGPGIDPASVRPYPPGLEMLAGDPTATEPEPTWIAGWACGGAMSLSADPPTCSADHPLRAKVVFPDCWNGRDLDTPDHRSHTAYSRDGRCPPEAPVPVPQLTLAVRYPVHGTGHDLELASGGIHSVHADFVNSWDQAALEQDVTLCLNRGLVCGVVGNKADDADRPMPTGP